MGLGLGLEADEGAVGALAVVQPELVAAVDDARVLARDGVVRYDLG